MGFAAIRQERKVGTILGVAAFVIAASTARLWFWRVDDVAIPENRAIFVVAFLSAVLLGIGAFVLKTRWFGALPALAGIVIGGFLPFSVAISQQEVAANGIQVGDTIPRFAALDENEVRFDSASLSGKRVLMKFFRGHW